MPLDKMPDSEQFVPTHRSVVLHQNDNPVACIIEKNSQNYDKYKFLSDDHSLKASIIGFLNKDEDLGLLMGFKLKIQTSNDFLEFTVYPDEEFIDTLIFNESLFVIDEKLDQLFYLKKIITDQFVKTRIEFEKFQKILK